MDAIIQFFNQDFTAVTLGIFILMSGIIAIVTIIGKFSEIIGKPVKWIRDKNADHLLLVSTANSLFELQDKHEASVKESIRHDEMIKKDLEKIAKMFIDKEIDDWRWEILDFSSAISSGREYNRESYEHIIKIFEKYERVLTENNMRNGFIEASMEVINDIYKEKLRTGF